MLEVHSALASVSAFAKSGIEIAETRGFTLTQVAGFGKSFEKDLSRAVGKLPEKIGIAITTRGVSALRIAPSQFWIIAEDTTPELPDTCLVTSLSSARCRIAISGDLARRVLARCVAIDFEQDAFVAGQFVITGIHHTPVLIHCINENVFHIYALRTFALNVWEWVVDVAEGIEP